MQHGRVRAIIEPLVADPGLGPRSFALCHVALLDDDPTVAAFADQALARALALPPGPSLTTTAYSVSVDVPDDATSFHRRFGTVLVDRSRAPAAHLELQWLLGQMWPHTRRNERVRLLERWLDLIHGTPAAAPGSHITREQLRGWQRNQLTAHDGEPPSPASLQGMLSETSPAQAYAFLAQFLGFTTHTAALARSLGILVHDRMLHGFDGRGRCLDHALAAACCADLSAVSPPDLMITTLSLLAHGIWFTCRRPPGRPLASRPASPAGDLVGTMLAGDILGTERLARLRCADRDRFRQDIVRIVAALLEAPGDEWLRALRAIAWSRLHDHDLVAPDAAACLGAQLATACHLTFGTGP